MEGYCRPSDIVKEVTNCNVPECSREEYQQKVSQQKDYPILSSEEIQNLKSNQKCQNGDVIFVLDSSSSITDENFKITRKFLKRAVTTSLTDFDSLRFAAMRYHSFNYRLWGFREPFLNSNGILGGGENFGDESGSSEAGIKGLEFQARLGLYNDILKKMIDDIPYNGRGTKTGNALKYVKDNFFKNPETEIRAGIRPNSRKIIVVITDGKAQDNSELFLQNQELQALGVEIIAVGITQGINMKGLLRISGREENVIKIDSYEELEIMKAVPKLTELLWGWC